MTAVGTAVRLRHHSQPTCNAQAIGKTTIATCTPMTGAPRRSSVIPTPIPTAMAMEPAQVARRAWFIQERDNCFFVGDTSTA